MKKSSRGACQLPHVGSRLPVCHSGAASGARFRGSCRSVPSGGVVVAVGCACPSCLCPAGARFARPPVLCCPVGYGLLVPQFDWLLSVAHVGRFGVYRHLTDVDSCPVVFSRPLSPLVIPPAPSAVRVSTHRTAISAASTTAPPHCLWGWSHRDPCGVVPDCRSRIVAEDRQHHAQPGGERT